MNQKIENELNLSLELDNAERNKTENLNTGYDAGNNEWELIIKYTGDVSDSLHSGFSLDSIILEYQMQVSSTNFIYSLLV